MLSKQTPAKLTARQYAVTAASLPPTAKVNGTHVVFDTNANEWSYMWVRWFWYFFAIVQYGAHGRRATLFKASPQRVIVRCRRGGGCSLLAHAKAVNDKLNFSGSTTFQSNQTESEVSMILHLQSFILHDSDYNTIRTSRNYFDPSGFNDPVFICNCAEILFLSNNIPHPRSGSRSKSQHLPLISDFHGLKIRRLFSRNDKITFTKCTILSERQSGLVILECVCIWDSVGPFLTHVNSWAAPYPGFPFRAPKGRADSDPVPRRTVTRTQFRRSIFYILAEDGKGQNYLGALIFHSGRRWKKGFCCNSGVNFWVSGREMK